MGLGKTAMMLSVVVKDHEEVRAAPAAAGGGQSAGPTLIICPTSVLENWENEICDRFPPALRPKWFRFYGNAKKIRCARRKRPSARESRQAGGSLVFVLAF
eukprot:SAG22_NODE_3467_length_1693_cov_1.146801_2_plen_101_part_00